MSSHQEPDLNIDGISAKDVVDYLHKHPRFFESHLDLLAEMKLPHPSGTAISLIERQVDVLRENNGALEKKLNNLISIARDNDRLNARIQKMALALMETSELDDVFYAVQTILHSEFNADLSVIRSFRDPKQPSSLDESSFVVRDTTTEAMFSKMFTHNRPVCGALDKAQGEFLFGDKAEHVISAALVPIMASTGNCIGLLAIGSYDMDRFHPAMGTIFLTYIGEMIGRTLEHHLQ